MATSCHSQRMARFREAGLYVVTSQVMSAGRDTEEVVRAALAAGVTLVQLREKRLADGPYHALAVRVRALTRAAGALFIVNDRVDVALSVEADGVHLGQDDFPIAAARRLGPDLIIGASTHSVAQVQRAQAEGASYINIGPLFPTDTKETAVPPLGMAGLAAMSAAATVPFSVMGGIKTCHVPDLVAAGTTVIAVVTAVTQADDPLRAAQSLLGWIRQSRSGQETGT